MTTAEGIWFPLESAVIGRWSRRSDGRPGGQRWFGTEYTVLTEGPQNGHALPHRDAKFVCAPHRNLSSWKEGPSINQGLNRNHAERCPSPGGCSVRTRNQLTEGADLPASLCHFMISASSAVGWYSPRASADRNKTMILQYVLYRSARIIRACSLAT